MAKLKYLVLHCTATPEGREVSSNDIRTWHTNPVSKGGRGWRQVGYTDLIHLNGEIERLVDNNEDANVDPWEITNGAKGQAIFKSQLFKKFRSGAKGKNTLHLLYQSRRYSHVKSFGYSAIKNVALKGES